MNPDWADERNPVVYTLTGTIHSNPKGKRSRYKNDMIKRFYIAPQLLQSHTEAL